MASFGEYRAFRIKRAHGMQNPGSGLEAVWKRFGSGLEAVWKRFGSGLEAVWKRFGSGLEAVREEVNHSMTTCHTARMYRKKRRTHTL